MTVATDYLLALVTAAAGVLTLRHAAGQSARRSWAVAFLALALAAALGGTYHGFAVEPLWLPTLLVIGIASAAMVAGSACATVRGTVRSTLLGLAALKLVLFSAWVWRDERFIWVVADTGLAFAIVAILHLARWREPGSAAILAGVAISLVAGLVQASGIDLHRHFNHNDLYHVIQMVAIVSYYTGVRRFCDRR